MPLRRPRDRALLVGAAVAAVAVLVGYGPSALPGTPHTAAETLPSTTTAPTSQPALAPSGSPTTLTAAPQPSGVHPVTRGQTPTAAAVVTRTPAAVPAVPAPAVGGTTPRRTAPPTTHASTSGSVYAGAFCADDAEGSTGRTSGGLLMRCTLAAGEDQPRWRAVGGPATAAPGTTAPPTTVRVSSAPRTLAPVAA